LAPAIIFVGMKKMRWLLLAPGVFFASCNNDDGSTVTPSQAEEIKYAPLMTYSIVNTLPHDTSSYTQGLLFYNGELLEGTGNYGKSKLKVVDIKTGKPKKEIAIDAKQFGEGITVLKDTLYQLTWQEKVVHVYDARSLKKIKEFQINTEGWGITHDSTNLIVTDGSNNLYYYDPSTFRLLRTQGVMEFGRRVDSLNELEFINGFIYANQYQTNIIYKIDPATGNVVSKLNLDEIASRVKQMAPYVDVLNGIAYNPSTNKVYITGKNWPSLFEIQFEH